MTPPVFEGEGDQIKILGRYVDQLSRSQRHIRLSWAAHHVVAFKRFLVRGQHSPESVKAPEAEPQLRELAEMIGIPTARLSRDQWAAVYKRILSSLLYRLDEFRRDGAIQGDRLDAESNVSDSNNLSSDCVIRRLVSRARNFYLVFFCRFRHRLRRHRHSC